MGYVSSLYRYMDLVLDLPPPYQTTNTWKTLIDIDPWLFIFVYKDDHRCAVDDGTLYRISCV